MFSLLLNNSSPSFLLSVFSKRPACFRYLCLRTSRPDVPHRTTCSPTGELYGSLQNQCSCPNGVGAPRRSRYCPSNTPPSRTLDTCCLHSFYNCGPRSHNKWPAFRFWSATRLWYNPSSASLESAFIICNCSFPSTPGSLVSYHICGTQHLVIHKSPGESFSE